MAAVANPEVNPRGLVTRATTSAISSTGTVKIVALYVFVEARKHNPALPPPSRFSQAGVGLPEEVFARG
jgi:hypothetical protein